MSALAVNPLLRRSIHTLTCVLAAVTALSCSDSLLGGGRRLARVVLLPQFSKQGAEIYNSLKSFGLAVTSLHVVLIRPNTTDTLAQTTVSVAEGQDSIAVTLEVPIRGSEERLIANLEMSSGGVIVFTGSISVIARIGASVADAAPVLVPVWVGPGRSATRIVISPRDQTLPVSGRVNFSATAFDANGTPVTDPEFVSRWQWRVNDATLGSLSASGGEFVPAGKAGVAIVTVFTPNLLRDTVRLTLITQLPLAKVTFARQLEVLNAGATSTVPVTALDPNGATVNNATFSFTSRTPEVASVSSTGVISGIAKGQAVIVVSGQQPGGSAVFQDSLLAVVAQPNAPVLIGSINQFELATNATVTVSVFADMRGSTNKLGSTTIDVAWNPAQLQFQSIANGASGVVPTVNTSLASTGSLTLAMADVAGFSGKIELLRIIFKTSATATAGTLALSAREMTAVDYTDLLSSIVQVTHPLSVR